MAKKRSRFERNIRVTHGPKIQRRKRQSKGSNFNILKSKPPIKNYLSDIFDEWRFNQYERGSPDKKVYRVKEQKITQLFDEFGNHDIEVRIDAVDEEGYLTITFLANGPGCKQKMKKRNIDYLNKEKEKEDQLEAKRLAERQKKIDGELWRFDHLRELAKEHKCASVYLIELNSRVRNSASEKIYPGVNYPETELHGKESRNFYVGITSQTPEDRFSGPGKNHISSVTGKVSKYRKIEDDEPFTESLEELEVLINEFGYRDDTSSKNLDYRFEHYLAWALYKIGHRVWGPAMKEVQGDLSWLGKEPFK